MYKSRLVILILLCSTMLLSGCWVSSSDSKEAVNVNSSIEKTDTKPVEKWLYPAYVIKDTDKKWGYINKEGKFVIEPAYDSADDFNINGVAIVKNKESYGLIDRSGKIILEPGFNYITYLGENLYSAFDGKNSKLVDCNGKVLFEIQGSISSFANGMADISHSENGKYEYGYINTEGKVVIEMQYSNAGKFNGDKAIVKTKDGKYILINKNGDIQANLNYEYVWGLSEGTMVYKSNNRYGYLKDDGSILIEAKYASVEPFSGGLAVISSADKPYGSSFGVINKKGEFTIEPQYPHIWRVGGGIFTVLDKAESDFVGMQGPKVLIYQDGNQLSDNKYYDITNYSGDFTSATDETSTFFIDQKGAIVKDLPKVDGIGSMKIVGDLVKANIDHDLMYYSKDGRKVWQSDDTYTLKDGIQVKSIKYRPNRATLIYYPQLSGMKSKDVQDKINSDIKGKFIESNAQNTKQSGKYDASMDETFKLSLNKDLLTVLYSSYYYPYGAAHGMPGQIYYHIDLNAGKFYTLSDLFKKDSNYTKRLSDIVGNQIAQKSKDNNAMIFPNSYKGIRADHNFIITKDALQLYFTPYEIAAYAAGFVKFDVPYNEILDIIDTEGAFWKSFDKNVTEAAASKPGTVQNANTNLTDPQINSAIKNYETYLIDAINKNDFNIVKPYLVKDSNLYKAQMELVANLNKQGIKEKLVDFTVKDVKQQANPAQVKVYVDENIAIQYPGQDFVAKQFSYIYTLVKTEGTTDYKLSDIEKWDK